VCPAKSRKFISRTRLNVQLGQARSDHHAEKFEKERSERFSSQFPVLRSQRKHALRTDN